MTRIIAAAWAILFAVAAVAEAGPYTEPGINGYIGPDRQAGDPSDPNAVINPIFRGWASDIKSYEPTPQYIEPWWKDPTKALGPATGDKYDIVSLGDLEQNEIDDGILPGQITLIFGDPNDADDPNHIRNVKGYDFVVFENGFVSLKTTDGGSVTGQMFTELGYVEVSSNGSDFVRFPAVSLTPGLVGRHGTIEVSDVYNLVGKHPNAYGLCTGTGFDLTEIANDPNVVSGVLDINNIAYVRIVDIPGSGDFHDKAVEHIDPNTCPDWVNYPDNHPVYDAWLTCGSGGLDLEAVGVLKGQEYSADINLDGDVDFFDFAAFAFAWQSHFGDYHWVKRADLAEPKDLMVDALDLAIFTEHWLGKEKWHNP